MSDHDPNRTVPRTPPAEQPSDDTKPRVADDSSADPNRTADHAPVDTPAGTGTVARTPSDVARLEEGAKARAAEGVPGYALLRELGRGGMGVVYEARHVKLNRVVALKMMLGGEQASRSELIRFLAEAEAVAAVKHENVVQVYDYGESEGRPYMALEYCPGGTLGKLLPKDQESATAPRQMAGLIAQVARGVAAAHGLGIVHRDLKPGNVFLDDTGTPKVADFGLAKRGEGADVTQAGVGMGTPSYMAPEQAKDAKFVGPQADVWALGVILYEALTGTRPFTGTVQEILARAQNAEPTTPRKVVGSVPRDLELICLKCLAKPPHERYPTAKELADDLDRYLRNEPISVRPVGPLERGYKWAKRNKVVAGAMAAVTSALLAGTGVSLGFGLYATDRAEEARRKQKEAEDATAREENEKRNAVAARNELAETNDELTGAVAKGFIGQLSANPLRNYVMVGSAPGEVFGLALSPHESAVMWELASRRRTPVSARFLEEATRTPLAIQKVERYSAVAVHSAVGLDHSLREKADRLFAARRSDDAATLEYRFDLVRVHAHSGVASPDSAERAARWLCDLITSDVRGRWGNEVLWQEELKALVRTMNPPAAARLLVRAMGKAPSPTVLSKSADALSAVIGRLSPEEAKGVSDEAAPLVADAITKSTTGMHVDYQTSLLMGNLNALVDHMTPEKAAAVCGAVARHLTNSPAPFGAPSRATFAAILAPHVPRDEAARSCDRAAALLLVEMSKVSANTAAPVHTLPWDAERLIRLTSRMSPDRVEPTCAAAAKLLADAIPRAALDASTFSPLVSQLIELAARLPQPKSRAVCETVADALFARLTTLPPATPIREDPLGLHSALWQLAVRTTPEKRGRYFADALAKAAYPPRLRELAKGAATVAPFLPLDEATDLCNRSADRLFAIMSRSVQAGDLSADLNSLAVGLSAVADRIPPDKAREVCDRAAILIARASSANTRTGVSSYAVGLSALMRHMSPDRARASHDDAVRQLTEKIAENPGDFEQASLFGGLALLSRFMARERAAQLIIEASGSRARVESPGVELRAATLGLFPPEYKRGTDAAVLAAGAFATPPNILPSLPLLHPRFHPQPKPLPPQDLVELLKHPFCVGEARRAVLDALEFTYKRTFRDQWKFVEFVQQNNVHDHTTGKPLDLLTPPKRPEPKP